MKFVFSSLLLYVAAIGGILVDPVVSTVNYYSPTTLTTGIVNNVAQQGMNQLLSFYDPTLNLIGNVTAGVPFWTTANAIETISNYMEATGDYTPLTIVENLYTASLPRYCSKAWKCFFDDLQWYVLAWIRTYEVTQNITYLNGAMDIYSNILTQWNGWNETCGGINWEGGGGSYVNAIPNELFLDCSINLARNTGSDTPVGNYSYMDWARTEWSWFSNGPMPITQTNPMNGILITDGISSHDCTQSNPTGAYWTYNQGVLLSGLAHLAVSENNVNLSNTAQIIANTAIYHFNNTNTSGTLGVLTEASCGTDGLCNGQDGKQFKGVFIRHLNYAYPYLSQLSPNPGIVQEYYENYILEQVSSILNMNTVTVNNGTNLQFGQLWQGPFLWDNNPWVTQGAALDVIIAGLQVLQRREQRERTSGVKIGH